MTFPVVLKISLSKFEKSFKRPQTWSAITLPVSIRKEVMCLTPL